MIHAIIITLNCCTNLLCNLYSSFNKIFVSLKYLKLTKTDFLVIVLLRH